MESVFSGSKQMIFLLCFKPLKYFFALIYRSKISVLIYLFWSNTDKLYKAPSLQMSLMSASKMDKVNNNTNNDLLTSGDRDGGDGEGEGDGATGEGEEGQEGRAGRQEEGEGEGAEEKGGGRADG